MKCRVIPYEGSDPYIFLSYCHQDSELVYPIIEDLAKAGYRIWYDEGIHPGDDWPENIARHLVNSSVCMMMISERSSRSHNCRQEMTFSIEKQKVIIPILLEKVVMSYGMKMQLSNCQYLEYYESPSQEHLRSKISEVSALVPCRGNPGSLPMRTIEQDEPRDYREQRNILAEMLGRDKKSAEEKNVERSAPIFKERESTSNAERQVNSNRKQFQATPISEQKIASEQDNGATIYVSPCSTSESEETVYEKNEVNGILLHFKGGRIYSLKNDQTKIGRSESMCDLAFSDNRAVSRRHAEIICVHNAWYLRDSNSQYGTYLNGFKLEPGQSKEMEKTAYISLCNERFYFASGGEADKIQNSAAVAWLYNRRNESYRFVGEEGILLDRNHAWEDGTLGDRHISRDRHAQILADEGKYFLIARHPMNATLLNGEPLPVGTRAPLQRGDVIRLGETELVVTIIKRTGE